MLFFCAGMNARYCSSILLRVNLGFVLREALSMHILLLLSTIRVLLQHSVFLAYISLNCNFACVLSVILHVLWKYRCSVA